MALTPDEWMDAPDKPPPPEMAPRAAELIARVKETFYAYTNRLDRSQQSTLGPSEAGTPCDRRLALHVLGMRPVNPGGDNWASFKGTCIHAGIADMFTWADASTGRYAIEVPLALPSALVPRGTADAIDRTMCLLLDSKTMGKWSMDKLRNMGPSPTQLVQLHLYTYAARRRGERIDQVALLAWPVVDSSLDDMWAWVGDYDPLIAPRALERVERIAADVRRHEDGLAAADGMGEASGDDGEAGGGDPSRQLLRIASEFKVADDCRYCPYSAPNDAERQFGCNGKK